MAAVVRNRFYPHIAAVLALFITVAFSRTYYFRFLCGPPLVRMLELVFGGSSDSPVPAGSR